MMALPNDPIMLLSMINLKLRDFYPTLDALCEDLDEDKAALCARLSAVGYAYDPQRNQFVCVTTGGCCHDPRDVL